MNEIIFHLIVFEQNAKILCENKRNKIFENEKKVITGLSLFKTLIKLCFDIFDQFQQL
jgi:hypothetical protein